MARAIRGLLLTLLVVGLCPQANAQFGQFGQSIVELKVDCDRGDDLQKALNLASRVFFATIRVYGTCEGSFTAYGNNYTEIIGAPGTDAGLMAGPGSALEAIGPGTLQVDGLRLTGGTGLSAQGDRRVVFLSNCDIEADTIGVRADWNSAVLVEDSRVTGEGWAVRAVDSVVVVQRTRLYGSDFGARVFGSQLFLVDAEVVDNDSGVSAFNRSTLEVSGSRFSENGYAHVRAIDDSRVIIYNSQLGAPDDSTILSFSSQGRSTVEIYADDPTSEIWGGANVHGDSFIEVGGATIHGSLQLREFSRLLLDGRVDSVGCRSAADAWCGPNADGGINGCASAGPVCRPVADAAPPARIPRPTIPEQFRRPDAKPDAPRREFTPSRRPNPQP